MATDLAFASELNGKVALVTGSSRGIGAGMVRALAQRGVICIVNYFADPAGQNEADAKQVVADAQDPSRSNAM